jgi:hypothetical protein
MILYFFLMVLLFEARAFYSARLANSSHKILNSFISYLFSSVSFNNLVPSIIKTINHETHLSYCIIIYRLNQLCSYKMAVSDELKSSHDEYAVQGRQGILIKEKLNFGEYSTTKVKRSWTKGSSSALELAGEVRTRRMGEYHLY